MGVLGFAAGLALGALAIVGVIVAVMRDVEDWR